MFAIAVFGSLLLIFLIFVAIGRWHPRSASDIWDADRHSRWETQAQIEGVDIKEMVDAQNEIRARHGQPPLTEAAVQRLVSVRQRQGIEQGKRQRKAGRTASSS